MVLHRVVPAGLVLLLMSACASNGTGSPGGAGSADDAGSGNGSPRVTSLPLSGTAGPSPVDTSPVDPSPVGTGPAGTGTGEPTPGGSTPPVTGAGLGLADNGRTVHLPLGAVLQVGLGGGQWVAPTSSRSEVLARHSATGGYPDSTPAEASFLALQPGTSALLSHTDFACLHTTPRCGLPTRIWQVTVVVP